MTGIPSPHGSRSKPSRQKMEKEGDVPKFAWMWCSYAKFWIKYPTGTVGVRGPHPKPSDIKPSFGRFLDTWLPRMGPLWKTPFSVQALRQRPCNFHFPDSYGFSQNWSNLIFMKTLDWFLQAQRSLCTKSVTTGSHYPSTTWCLERWGKLAGTGYVFPQQDPPGWNKNGISSPAFRLLFGIKRWPKLLLI